MLWRVIDESLPFLSKKWRDVEFEYNKVKMGEVREKPRYVQCIGLPMHPWNVAAGKLDVGLSSYYLRQYFDEKGNDLVSHIESLKKVF